MLITAEFLANVHMRQCARCKCAFPPENFHKRAGKLDCYCKRCRHIVNGPRESDGVQYHKRGELAYPDATKRCPSCGYTMAEFAELWAGDLCVFCAEGKH